MYGNLANATEQIRQGAVGQQLSGAGQLGQQAQAQQGMRNDAATNYWQQMLQQSGQQLAGAGMAGDMRELDYKDADRLAGVGCAERRLFRCIPRSANPQVGSRAEQRHYERGEHDQHGHDGRLQQPD